MALFKSILFIVVLGAFFFTLVIAGSSSDDVDLYNIATGTWSTAQLSSPRHDMAAVSFEKSIMLAGGYYDYYSELHLDDPHVKSHNTSILYIYLSPLLMRSFCYLIH